jgi:cytochrome c biogenesis protein CcdA
VCVPSVLGPGWLDRQLRVLLLFAVALALIVVPLLGASPASAAEGAGATSSSTVPADLAAALTDDGKVELLFFGSLTCPYCQQMEVYLDELEATFSPPLEVSRHEVSGDPAARARWETELLARGHTPSGVPTAILGDRVWIGFDENVARDVTRAVATLVAVASDDGEASGDQPAGGEPTTDLSDPTDPSLSLPLVGEVALAGRSALGITALIAFVDGFNPCSLWVLAILLAMVLNAGATRGRVIAVGTTFLAVTAVIYGAFIVGVFTVVDLLSSITAITVIVGVIALLVGGVNIKDYFAYQQGLSFTIPDRYKPRIYKGGRAIRNQDRGLLPVLGTTVALAAGVSIIELPCTMGFPVVWTGTLQSLGIGRGAEFGGLLGLYLLIYLIDELIVFAIVVITLQITRVEEKHGRALKLIGGSLMVVLGVAMIAVPTLLEDLTGLLLLTLAAVALTGVLVLVNRVRTGNGRNTGDGGDGTEAGLPRTPTSPGATSGRR